MLRGRLVLLGLVLAPGAAHGLPDWSPPVVVDPRDVVELPQIEPSIFGWPTVFVPALFAGAPNSLEVMRVDMSVTPPAPSTTPVATGNLFALGTFVRSAGEMGFSFVDGSFDIRFGHCGGTCDLATNSPVVAGTYVDSDSGASANRFWIAALNNTVPRTLSVRTSPDGIAWTPLYSYTPPETAGVCGQYNGCGRINLVVDPTAADVASALSCLTFEVMTGPMATARRAACFIGPTFQWSVTLDTDVPYSSPVLDRLTDARGQRVYLEHLFVQSVYNHRQSQTVRAFQLDPVLQQLRGPVELGPAPPPDGSAFGLASTLTAEDVGDIVLRAAWAGQGVGQAGHDVEWAVDDDAPLPRPRIFFTRQIALGRQQDLQPASLFLRALFHLAPPPLGGRGAESGLAIASYRLPLFDDGFETADTLRWTLTSP
ncbi:MAG: hypothetical protein F9K18_03490 [Thermoanaerobaculia bacterium]|nr:MAG: hypothetical protein F9K18_03490 [Thermoanaerobaculia bacterium]